MSEKDREKDIDFKFKYELPEITELIKCPSCKEGKVQLTRTVHKLPDGEDILIMLMECDNCSFQQNDVLTLDTSFKPGTWDLFIENEEDLTQKIFRSPDGHIFLPEANFEIEPGSNSGYLITNVEGIINRMIHWANYMMDSYNPSEKNEKKITSESLTTLNNCLLGKCSFHIILKDKSGGSYISSSKKEILNFVPFEIEKTDV
jgi:ZPR1-related zinc finger protein